MFWTLHPSECSQLGFRQSISNYIQTTVLLSQDLGIHWMNLWDGEFSFGKLCQCLISFAYKKKKKQYLLPVKSISRRRTWRNVHGKKMTYFPFHPSFSTLWFNILSPLKSTSQTKWHLLTAYNQIDLGKSLKYSTFICSFSSLQKLRHRSLPHNHIHKVQGLQSAAELHHHTLDTVLQANLHDGKSTVLWINFN